MFTPKHIFVFLPPTPELHTAPGVIAPFAHTVFIGTFHRFCFLLVFLSARAPSILPSSTRYVDIYVHFTFHLFFLRLCIFLAAQVEGLEEQNTAQVERLGQSAALAADLRERADVAELLVADLRAKVGGSASLHKLLMIGRVLPSLGAV